MFNDTVDWTETGHSVLPTEPRTSYDILVNWGKKVKPVGLPVRRTKPVPPPIKGTNKIKTVVPVKKIEASSRIPEDKYETPVLAKPVSPAISVIPNYTKYIIIGIISLLVYKSLKKG